MIYPKNNIGQKELFHPIVSNLEKGGYIYREKRPGNAKVVHLYTTPDGERLNTLYIAFCHKKNNRDTVRTIKGLLYQ